MQQKTARTLILCIGLACTLALACSAAEHREPINILFSGSANGILRSCHCPNAPWGGLAKRAWLIDRLRSVAGAETTIVLDTGDIFPVDRSLEQASLMVNLLALMNYDAVAVGDQELREGIDAWIAVNRQAGVWDEDKHQSALPWLSGGYRLAGGLRHRQMLVPPWLVMDRGSLRVGIVSIVGPESWRFAPSIPEGISLTDPARIIQVFLANTRGSLDLTIVLSHQGFEADRDLAARLDDVDLIIGGHSQSLISPPEVVNGIAICQAGKNGENLGLLAMTPRRTPIVKATPGEAQSHGASPDPDQAADKNPFLPTVVETLRWRIAQQIIPLTPAVEDDPEAARLIDAYYSEIEERNAARLAEPDPTIPPDAPRITVTLPSEVIELTHGERHSVAVCIANRGGAPLKVVRVRSRSPWLEVRSFPQQISPGTASNAVLEVVAERIDRFFRCDFSIMANDPRRRVVQGSFPGRVNGPMPGILDVRALWTNLTHLIADSPPASTPPALTPPAIQSNHLPKEIGAESSAGAQRLLVEFFQAPGCPDCREVEHHILPSFIARFADRIDLRKYDVTVPVNYLRLSRLQERLSVRSNEPVSVFVAEEIALLGMAAIRTDLERVVIERLETTPHSSNDKRPGRSPDLQQADRVAPATRGTASVSSVYASVEPTDNPPAPLKRRLEAFTVPAIILAGIVDGVNPCAFAAIVFFITLLGVSGVKSGRLLLVGVGYTLAVFSTYLIMGFGAFRLLQSLRAWYWLTDGLRWVMITLLAVLALLSFHDAWAFRRSGQPGDVALQLPSRLKRRMHEVMRTNLNPANLFLSALIIGCVVTIIEAVCTGQVYLPTLVLMSRYAETRASAFPLLLLYNLMFIIPVVIVIVAGFAGTRNQRLLEWSKCNVVWGKVLIGLLFIGLASALLVL